MITAGIDMGSKTVKVVILRDGEIIGKAMTVAGFESRAAAEQAFADALGEAGIQQADIEQTVATGAGRKYAPYTEESVTDVGYHDHCLVKRLV